MSKATHGLVESVEENLHPYNLICTGKGVTVDLNELVQELTHHPGRVALAVGDGREELVESLARRRETTALRVGPHLTGGDGPSTNIKAEISEAAFLLDIEILFAPQLGLDPLELLKGIARTEPPIIAVWPGIIRGNEAIYSEPGRPDYYRRRLENVILLRPALTALLGDPTFEVERVS